mgnify:CR=1 FL=1
MLNFEYRGIAAGKYVEGEIEAINNTEAAHKLKEKKVIITKLIQSKKKKQEVKKKQTSSFSFGSGVKAKEILIFAKQFATMLRAGLPVLNTLNMLVEQTKAKNMKNIIILCFLFNKNVHQRHCRKTSPAPRMPTKSGGNEENYLPHSADSPPRSNQVRAGAHVEERVVPQLGPYLHQNWCSYPSGEFA